MKSFGSILAESFAKVFLLIGVGVLIWSCVVTNPIESAPAPVQPPHAAPLKWNADIAAQYPGCTSDVGGHLPTYIIVVDTLKNNHKMPYTRHTQLVLNKSFSDGDPNNNLYVVGSCK